MNGFLCYIDCVECEKNVSRTDLELNQRRLNNFKIMYETRLDFTCYESYEGWLRVTTIRAMFISNGVTSQSTMATHIRRSCYSNTYLPRYVLPRYVL